MNKVLVLGIICAWGLPAGAAMGAEASAGIDVCSAYVWRGLTLNDGAVVQPWIELSAPNGVGINVWTNMDLGDYHGAREEGEISEVDLGLFYGGEVGPVELDVVYTEYLYPHQAGAGAGALAGTREIGANGAVDLLPGLGAEAFLYYDIDEAKGLYASLGLTYEYKATEILSWELDASAGFAGRNWAVANSGGEKGGLHEYTLSLRAAYTLKELLEIGVQVSNTGSLDQDVLPEQETRTYGGITASIQF